VEENNRAGSSTAFFIIESASIDIYECSTLGSKLRILRGCHPNSEEEEENEWSSQASHAREPTPGERVDSSTTRFSVIRWDEKAGLQRDA
jgi:hypothetical protein